MRNHWIEDLFAGLTRDTGFQTLVQRVQPDTAAPHKVLRVSGLTLTARAIYLALLFRTTGRHMVIVTDGNKQAEALHTALRTFCEPQFERPLRRSAEQAARLAMTTGYPMLVFPELFAELAIPAMVESEYLDHVARHGIAP